MKILFVCTGNTCRSCMAEAIAKHEAEYLKYDIEISSAGIYAFTGDSASENAIRVMEEMGLDISRHIARTVNLDMLKDYDLILTMTDAHKNTLLKIYPSFSKKIFSLMEYIGGKGEIKDPFGGSIEKYRDCAESLKEAILALIMNLRERQHH